MKKSLYLVFVLLLVCIFVLSACDTNTTPFAPNGNDATNDDASTNETTSNNNQNSIDGTKQIPIYQGMTITDSNSAILSLTSMSYRSSGIMLLSANGSNGHNGNNGNHYGHYKGDCTDDERFGFYSVSTECVSSEYWTGNLASSYAKTL